MPTDKTPEGTGLVPLPGTEHGYNVNSAIFWIRWKTVLTSRCHRKHNPPHNPPREKGSFFFPLLSQRLLPEFSLKFLSGKVIFPVKLRSAQWCVCTVSSSAALLKSTAFQLYRAQKNALKEIFPEELGCLMKAAAACEQTSQ